MIQFCTTIAEAYKPVGHTERAGDSTNNKTHQFLKAGIM